MSVNILYSRAGVAQQIAVENDSGFILVDVGDGTLRDLIGARIDRRKLRGILFTHGHFDHMGGLHSVLGFLRMIGRKDELPVIAPEGCLEVSRTIENFILIYGDSIPFRPDFREAGPGESFNLGGMIVESFPMVHCGSIEGGAVLDQIPATGYRISYNGESVAVSGDTGDCPSLRRMVTGADLAVIEATFEKSSDATPEELAKVHLSEDLATEIGALAKKHILVHKGRR